MGRSRDAEQDQDNERRGERVLKLGHGKSPFCQVECCFFSVSGFNLLWFGVARLPPSLTNATVLAETSTASRKTLCRRNCGAVSQKCIIHAVHGGVSTAMKQSDGKTFAGDTSRDPTAHCLEWRQRSGAR